MTRRLVGFNLGLAGLGLVLAVALGRELVSPRPQPGPPQIRPAASAVMARVAEAPVEPPSDPAMGEASAPSASSATDVIASGNLFEPSRKSAGAAVEPTGPRPLLYGVVAGDGAKSRAYVEDPVTKVVRGYQIGDTVAGWRLDQIREDRVVITGAERGMLEVLLREPGKPRPAMVASAAVTAEAHTAGPGAVETQRIEPISLPARQASTPDAIHDAVPRGIGPIPAQLFRPARAPSTPQATPAGQP